MKTVDDILRYDDFAECLEELEKRRESGISDFIGIFLTEDREEVGWVSNGATTDRLVFMLEAVKTRLIIDGVR